MFGWKSLFKNKSPPGGGETGWQPDGLDAAFPPKPFGAAAGRDPNLILMTESGAAHGGYGGFGGSAMVGTAGGLQIDLGVERQQRASRLQICGDRGGVHRHGRLVEPDHRTVGWGEVPH